MKLFHLNSAMKIIDIRGPILAVLFILGGLSACDNSLEPFDRASGFYSIYGAIDLHRDLNYVRVKDLNSMLVRDSTRNLEATVSLINLGSGFSDVLEDSVVELDSVFTHNFRIPYSLDTATDYRLLVEGDDGGVAWADTRTPEFAEVEITPEQAVFGCTDVISFRITRIPARNDLDITIGFELGGIPFDTRLFLSPGEEAGALISPPQQTIQEIVDDIAVRNNLYQNPPGPPPPPFPQPPYECEDLSDDKLFIHYTHYSPDFFEQNESDSTDVAGGAGRFGAFYRDSLTITIDTVRACAPNCP